MTASASAAPRRDRLASVDALRGGVMIVMALDHVRDFIHRGAMSQSPTDLATTTPILFLTRWVTHICAPVFMFTAGHRRLLLLAAEAVRRSRTAADKAQLSRFLVTRGLWLMVLELTVMQLAYNFDVSASYPIFLLVLWVLGACMIVLAALVWLPIPRAGGAQRRDDRAASPAGRHRRATFGSAAPLWTLLHQVGAFPVRRPRLHRAVPARAVVCGDGAWLLLRADLLEAAADQRQRSLIAPRHRA